jgi:hypothetical protein
VQVLRASTVRDMHGTPVEITPALMADLAASYDPTLYQAPVVIGHPAHNSPAFGLVTQPRLDGDSLDVGLADLDPAFVEAHRAKRYPQRSLSFWPAGHPDNPLPDKSKPYIRHLGFLGAMPPAIKGLRGADLATDPEGVIEIALANPSDPLATQSETPMPDAQAQTPQPPKNPPQPTSLPNGDAKATDLAERESALQAQEQALQAKLDALAAREQALAEAETARRRAEVTAFAEQLASDAKLRPVDVPRVTEIILALDEHAAQPAPCFAEADASGAVQERNAAAWLRDHLSNQPPLVALGEVATKGRAAADQAKGKSDAQVAQEARAYRARMAERGVVVSLAEAVDAVEAGAAE